MKMTITVIALLCFVETVLAVNTSPPELPTDIKPIEYRLNISVSETDLIDFTGILDIDVKCYSSADRIVLHSDVTTTKISLKSSKNKNIPVTEKRNQTTQRLEVLPTGHKLHQGSIYTLSFEFKGKLSNTSSGFYRSTYKTPNSQQQKLVDIYC